MTSRLVNILMKTTVLLAIVLAATSCGRRGNLEAPPSASVLSVDENGEELPEEDRIDEPFILDGLL